MFKFIGQFLLICFFASLSSCGKGRVEPETPSPTGDAGGVLQGDEVPAPSDPVKKGGSDEAKKNGGGKPSQGPKDDNTRHPSPPKTVETSPAEPKEIQLPLVKTIKIAEITGLNNRLKQKITDLGLLKGQSDAFKYYVLVWFSEIDFYIREKRRLGRRIKPDSIPEVYKEIINLLCFDNPLKCKTGLDLTGIDRGRITGMMHLLRKLFFYLFIEGEPPDTQPVGFIQGFLSPEDALSKRFKFGEGIEVHHRKIQEQVKDIEAKNIKDIVLNLPSQEGRDFYPFFLLGEVIKKQQADLHIIGNCGSYCVNYLLPAAKTVYIEPYYAHLTTRENFAGFRDDLLNIRLSQLEVWRKEVRGNFPSKEERDDLILSRLEEILSSDTLPPSQASTSPLDRLSKSFSDEDLYGEGAGQLVISSIKEFLSIKEFIEEKGKQSPEDLSRIELRQFVKSLPEELSDRLFIGFKIKDKVTIMNKIINEYEKFASLESDYYKRIAVRDLPSKISFGFLDLLSFSSRFVMYLNYANYFSVLRSSFYNLPEREKFVWVAPSSGLLRDLGLDVRGENNIDRILEMDRGNKRRLLPLNSEGVKNCGFSGESVSYDRKTLGECLDP